MAPRAESDFYCKLLGTRIVRKVDTLAHASLSCCAGTRGKDQSPIEAHNTFNTLKSGPALHGGFYLAIYTSIQKYAKLYYNQ